MCRLRNKLTTCKPFVPLHFGGTKSLLFSFGLTPVRETKYLHTTGTLRVRVPYLIQE